MYCSSAIIPIRSHESLRSSTHVSNVYDELVTTREIRGDNGSIGATANIGVTEGLGTTYDLLYAKPAVQLESNPSYVEEVQGILKQSETIVDRLECLESTNTNLLSAEKLRHSAKNLREKWTRLVEKIKIELIENKVSLLDFANLFFLLERLTNNFAFVQLPNILTLIKIAENSKLDPFEQKDDAFLEKIKLQLECLSKEMDTATASVENDPILSNIGLYCPLAHLKHEFDGQKLFRKEKDTRGKLAELGKRHDGPKAVTDFWYLLSAICEENGEALSVQDKWKNEEKVSLAERLLFVKQFVEVQAILKVAEQVCQIYEFELASCEQTRGQPRKEFIHKLEQQIMKHREYLRFMRKGHNERKGFNIEPEVQDLLSNQRALTERTFERVDYSGHNEPRGLIIEPEVRYVSSNQRTPTGHNEPRGLIIEPEVRYVSSNQRTATEPTYESVDYSNTDGSYPFHFHASSAQMELNSRDTRKFSAKIHYI